MAILIEVSASVHSKDNGIAIKTQLHQFRLIRTNNNNNNNNNQDVDKDNDNVSN